MGRSTALYFDHVRSARALCERTIPPRECGQTRISGLDICDKFFRPYDPERTSQCSIETVLTGPHCPTVVIQMPDLFIPRPYLRGRKNVHMTILSRAACPCAPHPGQGGRRSSAGILLCVPAIETPHRSLLIVDPAGIFLSASLFHPFVSLYQLIPLVESRRI